MAGTETWSFCPTEQDAEAKGTGKSTKVKRGNGEKKFICQGKVTQPTTTTTLCLLLWSMQDVVGSSNVAKTFNSIGGTSWVP